MIIYLLTLCITNNSIYRKYNCIIHVQCAHLALALEDPMSPVQQKDKMFWHC